MFLCHLFYDTLFLFSSVAGYVVVVVTQTGVGSVHYAQHEIERNLRELVRVQVRDQVRRVPRQPIIDILNFLVVLLQRVNRKILNQVQTFTVFNSW